MLFVIALEALHGMLEKVNQGGLISGFTVENSSMEINHLQFVDDIIVFCDAKVEEINSLKAILKWFEMISGLNINYEK